MISMLLGMIGIAICVLSAVDAWRYWDDLTYVMPSNYAMMVYYGLIFLVGVFFILC